MKPDIFRPIFYFIYLNVIFVHNTKLASIDLKRITTYSTFCRKERQKIIDTGIQYIYLLTNRRIEIIDFCCIEYSSITLSTVSTVHYIQKHGIDNLQLTKILYALPELSTRDNCCDNLRSFQGQTIVYRVTCMQRKHFSYFCVSRCHIVVFARLNNYHKPMQLWFLGFFYGS